MATVVRSTAIAMPDLNAGDFVELVGLVEAKHLNGKRGVVNSSVDPTTGRVSVLFHPSDKKGKKVKVENLQCRPLPVDVDDPRVAFVAASKEKHMVRIEHGAGKTCRTCGLDLAGEYHVQVQEEVYCEEHYVQQYIDPSHQREFVRTCTICQEYIPIRDGVALPSMLLEEGSLLHTLYPTGCAPDGRPLKLITHDGTEQYWAHRSCFECSLCGIPMWEDSMTPYGFTVTPVEDGDEQLHWQQPTQQQKRGRTRKRWGVVHFFCGSKDESDVGCDQQYPLRQHALKRKFALDAKSVPELQALLTHRHVPYHEEDDQDQLIRKIIVTDHEQYEDDNNDSKQNHCNHNSKSTRRANNRRSSSVTHLKAPPSLLERRSSVPNLNRTNSQQALVLGFSAPGSILLDKQCRHGSQMVYRDSPDQHRKRKACAMYIQSNNVKMGNGITAIAPFHMCCMSTVTYWSGHGGDNKSEEVQAPTTRLELLVSDVEERFIPKVLWCAAVAGTVQIDGGYEYQRMAVAGSLITHAMLDRLVKHQSATKRKPVRKSIKMVQEANQKQQSGFFDDILEEPSLKRALHQIQTSANTLYHFMDGPQHRVCDCLQYIATAAELGSLRLSQPSHYRAKASSSSARKGKKDPYRVTTDEEDSSDSEDVDDEDYDKCALCHEYLAEDARVACTNCNKVLYCSEKCQKAHWTRTHERKCRKRSARKQKKSSKNGSGDIHDRFT